MIFYQYILLYKKFCIVQIPNIYKPLLQHKCA